MKRQVVAKKLASIAVSLTMILTLAGIIPAAAHAENFQFITDIRVATGEEAYDQLEDDGYSVRAVGLNATSGDGQIYIGYKINDGDPITNVVISSDVGDAFDSETGIHYVCAGHVDADANNGEGAGCVYMTRDPKAGDPIVGLDVLRSGGAENKKLLPITNDGAEVVRRTDGIPADLEVNSDKTIYLAQIRDGIVKPYIRDVTVISAADMDSAVYTAAANGYNYYVEGDIDDSGDSYTILAYERTADKEEALRSMLAVSAELIELIENEQIIAGAEQEQTEEVTPEEEVTEETAPEEEVTEETAPEEEVSGETASEEEITEEETAEEAASEEAAPEEPAAEETESEEEQTGTDVPSNTEVKMTADAIDISGVEYDRLVNQQIAGSTPYFLYVSKDEKAGNPITMLYAGDSTDMTETTLGTWVYGYFTAQGPSSAYSFTINEDKLESLKDKDSTYVKMPINLLTGAQDEQGISFQTSPLTVSLLTAKKGLPEDSLILNGLRKATYDPPQIARAYEGEDSDLPASAFGNDSILIILAGIVVLVAVAFGTMKVLKKRKGAAAK